MNQLDRAVRADGGRIVAALAARFRDLDIAEDALAEACARAARLWDEAPPANPAGWLYRVAERVALDQLRRGGTRAAAVLEPPEPNRTPEERLMADDRIIPDERLRLIFTCCHPAIASEARVALTLRLVCGLSTAPIAQSLLIGEPALMQRLTRAKRKIAAARIPYEVPGPPEWPERIDAVLSTVEIAYSHAHADAAGTGPYRGYAAEMLALTATLAGLMPGDADAAALAATLRFAEARRPARVDADGVMVPLDMQDPARWNAALIEEGRLYLGRATAPGKVSARVLQALTHARWCARGSLSEPAPWRDLLTLYNALVAVRDDAVVRLNRAVALSHVVGAAAALEEVDALDLTGLASFLPYHAVRADLLARLSLNGAAGEAYDAALALKPGEAEQRWLERRRANPTP